MRRNHLCMKRISLPLTHVPLRSKPMLQSALFQVLISSEISQCRIWLSCSREDVMLSNIAMCFTGHTELSPIWQQAPKKYGAHALLWAHGFVKNSGSGPPLSHAAAATPLASLSYPWTNLTPLLLQKPAKTLPHSCTTCWIGAEETLRVTWCKPCTVGNVRADMTNTKKEDRTVWKSIFIVNVKY